MPKYRFKYGSLETAEQMTKCDSPFDPELMPNIPKVLMILTPSNL